MLSDFHALVTAATRDDAAKLSPTDFDSAISLAVAQYGKDRPVEVVEDVAAASSNLLNLPTGWQADFSQLNSLEYPIGTIPPEIMRAGSWGMYRTPTGQKVQLADAVAVGALVRATYTIAHVLDATHDTIPVGDREAVMSYAAAICSDQLASLYSNDQDSTIAADSVQHNSKAREFAARARTLRQRYFDLMGVDPKQNSAAGVVVNLDQKSSIGRDRLTHPRRFR